MGDMLALLAAVSLVQVQEAEIPAIVGPLDRLIPEIGAHFNMKLIAGASVKSDVVGIASPKRPAKVILDGIAKAVNATWEERPEGLVLVRTRKQEAEDAETDAKFRESWIRDALESTPISEPFDQVRADALAAYWYEFKSKQQLSESDYAQLDTMNSRSPLGRFTRRLVEAMGVERLARLPQRSITVFATRPTKMQRLLDIPNFEGVVRTYVEEQNLYAAAAAKVGKPPNDENRMFVSGFDRTRAIAPKWDKVRLVVDTSNVSQTFLRVEFCSADGKPTSSAEAYFNRNFRKGNPALEGPNAIIPYDEAAKAVLKVTTEPFTGETHAPILTDVLTRDPLDYTNRSALDTWSKETNKPVFALLSDGAMSLNLTEPYRLASYRANLSMTHIVDDSGSTITIRPNDLTLTRQTRINRTALQTAIKDRNDRGFVTLESAMNLLSSRPLEAIGAHNAVRTATMGEIQSFLPSEAALHLIAKASPAQRNALLAGTAVGWNELNDAQRTIVTELMYARARSWGHTPVSVDNRDRLPGEPTEAFPNGPPTTIVVTTEARTEDGVRVKQGRQVWASTAGQLAATLYQGGELKGLYQLATVRRLSLNVDLNPHRRFGYRIVEGQVDPKSAWGAYETLPQSLRDEVARLAEQYRRGVPPKR